MQIHKSMKMQSCIDTEIQFSGLKPGRYEYAYTLGREFFEGFENENLRDGNVNFDVKLVKTEHELLFTFSFRGFVKTECDRCLGEMEVEVDGEETMCVKFSDTPTEECEDEVVLPTSAFKVDLAQWMYEYVVLAMPIQHVHPDDEEGNSTCDPEMLSYIQDEGQERSANEVDPRWAKLLDLK